MKIITISIILFLLPAPIFSQIAIGKSNTTAGSNLSLEFYDQADNVKGLVLPWVSTVAGSPVAYDSTTGAGYRGMQGTVADGTLIFDLYDSKVKYMRSGSWYDLTGAINFPLVVKDAGNNTVTITQFNAIDSSLQNNKKEQDNAKTIIGSNAAADTTPGILVLSDSNKAMILPKVASPHLNIINPTPGMIVFDTVKKQLAVYNGTIWSFWKP